MHRAGAFRSAMVRPPREKLGMHVAQNGSAVVRAVITSKSSRKEEQYEEVLAEFCRRRRGDRRAARRQCPGQAGTGVHVHRQRGPVLRLSVPWLYATGYGPAFQGGFDFAHKSGFYLGNWNSNVEQGLYNGASLEMDFYGGYKGTVGDFGYDIGYIYYYYPKSGAQGTTKVNNGELYLGASYGPVSAKWYYGTTKFFWLGKGPTSAIPSSIPRGRGTST